MHHETARRLGVGAILGFALAAAGCNGGDLVGTSVLGGGGGNSPVPIATIDPTNPHNGGSDVNPPTTVITPGDSDGDGIPDGQDNIPCMAFYIKVWNQQVSSAEVSLDNVVIIPTSAFPTDQVIQQFINPTEGTNTMTLGSKLAGSPQDELHIEIWDMNGNLYLHETVVRGGGSPEEPPPMTFDVNVQC